ncbi:hypothetical protein V7O62_12420 [Methanolobus sp. ZRKC2]|uniref:hypothetical protein n=1 Tax=Methanolobus sp. ZRKC2 TaxID=3125783 RepID=UPI0032557690
MYAYKEFNYVKKCILRADLYQAVGELAADRRVRELAPITAFDRSKFFLLTLLGIDWITLNLTLSWCLLILRDCGCLQI